MKPVRHPHPAATDASGVHVWLVLMKAHAALGRHAARSIDALALGGMDFRVLEALLHKGPLPVNSLGPKVELTPGAISVAVDRLVQKGLVVRQESAEDRRVRMVALTPAGRKIIAAGFREHRRAMEAAAAGLEPGERRALVVLLKKLGLGADELLTRPARKPSRRARG